MKFFDEMHVGFQRERYTNADEPRLLGFMVPNGTTKPDHIGVCGITVPILI